MIIMVCIITKTLWVYHKLEVVYWLLSIRSVHLIQDIPEQIHNVQCDKSVGKDRHFIVF